MLQIVIAFCLRFIHNSFTSEKISSNLSIDELLNSTKVIIKHLQNQYFSVEISGMKNKAILNKSSVCTDTIKIIRKEMVVISLTIL